MWNAHFTTSCSGVQSSPTPKRYRVSSSVLERRVTPKSSRSMLFIGAFALMIYYWVLRCPITRGCHSLQLDGGQNCTPRMPKNNPTTSQINKHLPSVDKTKGPYNLVSGLSEDPTKTLHGDSPPSPHALPVQAATRDTPSAHGDTAHRLEALVEAGRRATTDWRSKVSPPFARHSSVETSCMMLHAF